ncbi:hypothetical protein ACTXT7_000272 [Hymenolepis weldensis]
MKHFAFSSLSQTCLPLLVCCMVLCFLGEINAVPRGVLNPTQPEDMLDELSYQNYLRMRAGEERDLEKSMEKRMPFLSRLGKRFYAFRSRLGKINTYLYILHPSVTYGLEV